MIEDAETVMTEGDLVKLANEVLAPILGPVGFLKADVEIAPDPAGDDALLVTTHFRPEAEVTTGRAYIDAQVALMDALVARGDRRFPYFRYDYPSDPAPFDEVQAYGAS